MKTGIELIGQERKEQIEKHGRTETHDIVENNEWDMMYAAIAILTNVPSYFPQHWEDSFCERVLRKPLKERLIIAGALIAAEIDRINFLEAESFVKK